MYIETAIEGDATKEEYDEFYSKVRNSDMRATSRHVADALRVLAAVGARFQQSTSGNSETAPLVWTAPFLSMFRRMLLDACHHRLRDERGNNVIAVTRRVYLGGDPEARNSARDVIAAPRPVVSSYVPELPRLKFVRNLVPGDVVVCTGCGAVLAVEIRYHPRDHPIARVTFETGRVQTWILHNWVEIA